jgi:ADP-ribose pyrophosphatase YjhB (NUDIX family)
MNLAIQQYLDSHEYFFRETANWPNNISLLVSGYLTTDMAPSSAITSVRGVVIRDNEVLAVRDHYQWHITPGGRRENEESFEETRNREMLEETGWRVHNAELFSVIHFKHQTPMPDDYKYPYPDFFHLVYLANALSHHPDLQEKDGYERESKFLPLHHIEHLGLSWGQKALLNAALSIQRRNR